MKKWKETEPCNHPGCMHHVSHPCEGCGRQWGQKNYTITEALKNVKDAAMEGRKLEAWCDDSDYNLIYRYNPSLGGFQWRTKTSTKWAPSDEDHDDWSTAEVFGTWHVGDVEE